MGCSKAIGIIFPNRAQPGRAPAASSVGSCPGAGLG